MLFVLGLRGVTLNSGVSWGWSLSLFTGAGLGGRAV